MEAVSKEGQRQLQVTAQKVHSTPPDRALILHGHQQGKRRQSWAFLDHNITHFLAWLKATANKPHCNAT
jgi:hypothetical protein